MADLHNFHRLAATTAPAFNVSVRQELRTTATYTAEVYAIKADSNTLPAPIEVEATTEAQAVVLLGRSIARARRSKDAHALIASLKSDYTDEERDALLERLLTVHFQGYHLTEARILKDDKARYDQQMGAQDEQQGYSDGWAHND